MSARPKVFVTRLMPDAGMKLIQDACDADVWPEDLPPRHEALLARVRGVEGIVSMVTDPIDEAVIEAARPTLKVISQMAVGYDNVDVQTARVRGIPVGHTPDVLTDATADLTFALLLASARRIVEGMDYIRDGNWITWGPKILLGADVTGATLGIIGLGRIGRAVAERAKAFKMNLLTYSPRATFSDALEVGAMPVSLDALLTESDFVSIHAPLSDATRHMIDAEALAKMKPTAVLINTSRGPVVDQKALVDALKNGTIRAAALDVTDPEPMAADDPLLQLPNCIVAPHIGSATVQTRDKMAQIAAKNLLAGLKGDPLPHPVPGG